ncbi:MAG: DUF975 family protein [Clostridiales bacterium]|nr:DUF975 family protein [Clostridiales bacterium]
MATNYELKHKARAALKNNWQTALMVCLIASLPSLASQVVTLMSQGGYTQAMTDMLAVMQNTETMNDPVAAVETMNAAMDALMPMTMASMATLFLSPFLTLGMLGYFFRLLRGEQDVPVSTVFSCGRIFFKALGLNVMVTLRILLWMLPGMGLSLVGTVAALFLPEGLAGLGTMLMYTGLIAMLVLGIRAGFHFAMADRIMAETPAKGINQCINESMKMMRNRKLLLFSLEISFILYEIALLVLEMLLEPVVGGVLTSTVSMTLSFVLNIYVQMAVSVFYLVYHQPAEI